VRELARQTRSTCSKPKTPRLFLRLFFARRRRHSLGWLGDRADAPHETRSARFFLHGYSRRPGRPLIWGAKMACLRSCPHPVGWRTSWPHSRWRYLATTGKPELLNYIAVEPVVLGPGSRSNRMASASRASRLDLDRRRGERGSGSGSISAPTTRPIAAARSKHFPVNGIGPRSNAHCADRRRTLSANNGTFT